MALASFGGVSFRLLVGSPGLDQEAIVGVTQIPGGNNAFVDVGGVALKRFKGEVCLADYAAYSSLLGQLGVSGTLSYSEASFTATLLSCHRTKVVPSGQLADVEWLITA